MNRAPVRMRTQRSSAVDRGIAKTTQALLDFQNILLDMSLVQKAVPALGFGGTDDSIADEALTGLLSSASTSSLILVPSCPDFARTHPLYNNVGRHRPKSGARHSVCHFESCRSNRRFGSED